MRIGKGVEFAVSLPNRPGSFANLATQLADRGVHIRAFMLYTSYVMNVPDVPLVAGVCKLIMENDQEARKAFHELGIKFSEEEVLLAGAPQQRGTLANVVKKLAGGGISVKDGYATTSLGQEEMLIVLSVSDVEGGLSLLGDAALGGGKPGTVRGELSNTPGKPYRVWIEIDGVEPPEITGNHEKRVSLAEFDTWEEAFVFKTEMEQRYAPLATGEAKIVDEVLTPDLFTAGD